MKIAAAAFFTVTLIFGSAASAQSDYPSRPIKIIAPVPAGSSADMLARIYSRVLQEKWGQPIVIENRVGASHNIGAGAVWRAAPDGYTIMTAPPPSLAINKYLFPNLNYDPESFVPVTVMVDVPNVLVVRPGLAAKDVKGLIALAKAKPGLITYASTGKGSTLHLAAESFRNQANIELLYVPFTGVPQLISELTAERVDMTLVPLIDVYPYIQNGSLRALGVGSDMRSQELPDVPTIGDTLPGYHATAWFAVALPPKAPAALAEKLSDAIREAFKQPEAAQQLKNLRGNVILNSPTEAAAFIKADSERWRRVIIENKIDAE